MTLSFHPLAKRDLKTATAWYRNRSLWAAQTFVERVDEAAKRILASPQLFLVVELGCRRALVRRFPYSLIFRWQGDQIVIVAVSHGKRKGTHWHHRVK